MYSLVYLFSPTWNGTWEEKEFKYQLFSSYLLQFKRYETGITHAPHAVPPTSLRQRALRKHMREHIFYFFFLLIFDSFNICPIQRSDSFSDPRDMRYICNNSSVSANSEEELLDWRCFAAYE